MARNASGADRLEVVLEPAAVLAWLRGDMGCEPVETALITRACGISAAGVFELLEAMPSVSVGAILAALETARVRIIPVDANSLRALQLDSRSSLALCHARSLVAASRAEHLGLGGAPSTVVTR